MWLEVMQSSSDSGSVSVLRCLEEVQHSFFKQEYVLGQILTGRFSLNHSGLRVNALLRVHHVNAQMLLSDSFTDAHMWHGHLDLACPQKNARLKSACPAMTEMSPNAHSGIERQLNPRASVSHPEFSSAKGAAY